MLKGEMVPSVKSVIPLGEYRLAIEFANGEHGVLDMKPFLDFGVFRKLKNDNSFKQVRVSFDTIEWTEGADLDPEFVYVQTQKHSAQVVARF